MLRSYRIYSEENWINSQTIVRKRKKLLFISKTLLMNVKRILNRSTENVKRDNAEGTASGVSFTINREKMKDTLVECLRHDTKVAFICSKSISFIQSAINECEKNIKPTN